MKIDQKTNASGTVMQQLQNLGVLLKGARIDKQLTHQDLASACGISRQTLSRIERGDPSVAIGQVARYAERVGAFSEINLFPSQPLPPINKRVRKPVTVAS